MMSAAEFVEMPLVILMKFLFLPFCTFLAVLEFESFACAYQEGLHHMSHTSQLFLL
jgi:hypothetical protein